MKYINFILAFILLGFPFLSIAQISKDYRKDFIKYHKKYISEHNIEPVLDDIIILKKPEVWRYAGREERDRVDSLYDRKVSAFRDSLYFAGYLLKSGAISGKGGPDVVVKNDKDAIDLARKLKFDVLMTYIQSNKFLFYRLEPITLQPSETLVDVPIVFYPDKFEFQLPEIDYCKIEKIVTATIQGRQSRRLDILYRSYSYKYAAAFSYFQKYEIREIFHLFRGGKLLARLEIVQPRNDEKRSGPPDFFVNGQQIPVTGDYAKYKAAITGEDLDYHKRMVVWYFRDNPNKRCKYPVKSSNWKSFPADERQGPMDDWEIVYDDEHRDRVRYKAVGSYWCNASENEQLIFPIEFILSGKKPQHLTIANDPENINAGKK